MSLFPDEPLGVVGTSNHCAQTIHTDVENCPYAPETYRETREDDLRANARICSWCDAHGDG